MINLNFIYSELFLALSIMTLLIVGVFKKNSSILIYNLTQCLNMKQNKNNIVITSATRTAIGKFNGQFAKLKGIEKNIRLIPRHLTI